MIAGEVRGDSEGTEQKSRPTHAKLGHKETTERLLVNIMNRKLVELSEHVRRRILVTGHVLYIIELPTMFSSAVSLNSYLSFCMNWRSFLSTHKHILTRSLSPRFKQTGGFSEFIHQGPHFDF